jgi:hypothetical protein
MATYPVDGLGTIGIIRDAAPHELPPNAWSDGKNVRFADGYVERMRGHQVIYGAPPIEPYFLLPYSMAGARNWIYAGAQKMYAVSVDTHSNITRQTGGVDVDYSATPGNVWTGTDIGGVAVLNNGVDVPQVWAGTGRAVNLPDWTNGLRCKAMRKHKFSLVAMNLIESGVDKPHRVLVSHPAEPGTVPASWDTADATKDVVVQDLSKTEGRLVDGASIGDHFYLYKESSIYRMSYVGGNDIWAFSEPISEQAGALAVNCIARFDLGHAVLGQGDVFLNTGSRIESILNQKMRRWLQTSMDASNYDRSFLATNPTRNEVWVCIPRLGASVPNVALVWNYKDNVWTIRDLPRAHYAASGVIDTIVTNSFDSRLDPFDSYTDPFDYNEYTQASQRMVIASAARKLYLADASRLFDETNFQSYVARTGLDLGDPQYFKLVSAVYPRIEGAAGNVVRVYVGGYNDIGKPVTWSTPRNFVIGTDTKVDVTEEWRYIAIKFETVQQATWRLKSYLLEYQKTGMW